MKKFLKYCLIVVLLVVGLALIFNQQIKNALVSHMTTSAVSTTVVKPQQNSKKANFDFKKIKAVDSQMRYELKVKTGKKEIYGTNRY